MDYPRYLANGWCIGSGAMESACKTVVGQRLKLSGMRWGPTGTDDMFANCVHSTEASRNNGNCFGLEKPRSEHALYQQTRRSHVKKARARSKGRVDRLH